jgi:hypothetical protein
MDARLAWCTWMAGALCALAAPATGQEVRGRILDSENGVPVGLAAIFLLDADRSPLLASSADVEGRYRVQAPGAGAYYLVVERLGYFENETPLFAVGGEGEYGIDIEMRPEPFRLDPLAVTVDNDRLEDFLTRSLGEGRHPASFPGYRAIQGLRLEQAKLKAKDNVDLLRWLYVPVSVGSRTCVGSFGGPPLPARTSADRTMAASSAAQTGAVAAAHASQSQCGALYVDDYRCPNELVHEIDMDRIAVIVTLEGSVHMYTREFDWTFRPGGSARAC